MAACDPNLHPHRLMRKAFLVFAALAFAALSFSGQVIRKFETVGGGGAIPVFEEFVATSETTGATSWNVANPTASAGDIWLRILHTRTDHDFDAAQTGMTQVGSSVSYDSGEVSVFWYESTGAEGATTDLTDIFVANEQGFCHTLRFSGVASSPVDATNGASSAASTAKDVSETSTVVNTLAVAIIAADPDAGGLSFAWDGGITEVIDDNDGSTHVHTTVGIKGQASIGAVSLGGDYSASEESADIIILLKP